MSQLFLKFLNMSISAGWLILAVLLLRLVLKKAPKWTHVLLWGIVALRLIFPFSLVLLYVIIASGEPSDATKLVEYLICCELGGTVVGAGYHKSKH